MGKTSRRKDFVDIHFILCFIFSFFIFVKMKTENFGSSIKKLVVVVCR